MRALFLFVCVARGACLFAPLPVGLFVCAGCGVAYKVAYKANGAAVVYWGDGAAAVSSSG